MKSKSSSRLKAATATTIPLKAMPIVPLAWIAWTDSTPKRPRIQVTRYARKIAPVAATIPVRSLSVTGMIREV